VFSRELTVVGSFVNPHTFSRAIALLVAGIVRIDVFRISRFPFERALDALQAVRDGEAHKSMVVSIT
jgi:threonine dehydrogenase-like Zn-dependent dehydrogenase